MSNLARTAAARDHRHDAPFHPRSTTLRSDRYADVMAMHHAAGNRAVGQFLGSTKGHATNGAVLQRKCACGAAASGKCASCQEKEMLQRASAHSRQTQCTDGDTPAIVGEVLRSPGHALDPVTRQHFESRFNHDFGHVRVHSDARAAESAQAVDALAYTVGRDVVFGSGRYAPQSDDGRKLLAHELTHVLQQAGSTVHGGHSLRLGDPSSSLEREADAAAAGAGAVHEAHGTPTASSGVVQRVCSKDPECQPEKPSELPGSAVKGSPTHFDKSVEREEKKTAVKKKRKTPEEIREEHCSKEPPDPECTSDGHGRRAVAIEEVFRSFIATQSKTVTGIFVDMDMASAIGGRFTSCSNFTPEIEGDRCIFIPDSLEQDAAKYLKGEKKIDGMSREDWLTDSLSTLTHEFEHAHFREKFPKTKPRPEACDFASVRRELSELAAEMSEFPVHYRALAKKSWTERRSGLEAWFKYKLTQPQRHGETIAGILKAIRCRCECDDVDAYIKSVVKFTTENWTEVERNTFHTELRNPRWKLDWPIETPLPPSDLPGYMLRPHLDIGYSRLGAGGISFDLGLDVGIPLDRLGKWQLLLGAQGRLLGGSLSTELESAYLLGLKFGFLKGPALGEKGLEFGLYGEAGGGSFQEGVKTERGTYAGGGISLAYRFGLSPGKDVIPFIGLEAAGGARIDWSKPAVQKWFVSGVTASFGFEF